jgi:hypothetical protein
VELTLAAGGSLTIYENMIFGCIDGIYMSARADDTRIRRDCDLESDKVRMAKEGNPGGVFTRFIFASSQPIYSIGCAAEAPKYPRLTLRVVLQYYKGNLGVGLRSSISLYCKHVVRKAVQESTRS